jgi:large subunit ribosomal protein L9
MANTEVILTENVPGLGAEADIVKVRAGYARNFLIPRGRAYEVTPVTLRHINLLRARRAEREARELNEAQELARKIGKLKITLTLETGETGKAFGSITAKDIAERIKVELGGLEIERHRIVLERPIKETGPHEVPIKLQHDITATLNLNVKSSAAETEEGASAEGAAPAAEKGEKGVKTEKRGGYKAKIKAKRAK